MYNQKKKKRCRGLLLLVCMALMLSGSSCSEDLDRWEPLNVDVSSNLPESKEVSYEASSFTLEVKTNGKWTLICPDWMTASKTEGFGDETLTVEISANPYLNTRSGNVEINFGSEDVSSNVIGTLVKRFSVKQTSKTEAVSIEIVSAELNKQQTYNYEVVYYNNKNYVRYHHNWIYTVTYKVTSSLSDKELAEMVQSPLLKMEMTSHKFYSQTTMAYEYSHGESIDVTRGEHTVTFTYPQLDVESEITQACVYTQWINADGKNIVSKDIHPNIISTKL